VEGKSDLLDEPGPLPERFHPAEAVQPLLEAVVVVVVAGEEEVPPVAQLRFPYQ